ncbi:MAG: hypothetical protein HC856_06600 [Pseudanabaena sp. RU_4_16]|nr:hypothetical protein [Pseudanabaena sp. RU_4_16]NKB17853.1 hypothetical protein [Pseudanabaena sp. CRU_2_10]
MLPETLSEKLPYWSIQGGIVVCRQLQTKFGTWHPPVILPYYWKENVLKVVRCLPEHGFDKACPIDASRRWPNYTDFFIVEGVMLFAYPKVDGYLPIYLGELTGEEANLISLREFEQTRIPINSDRELDNHHV